MDDLINNMYEQHPLLYFSQYTYSQAWILIELGNDILSTMDEGIAAGSLDYKTGKKIYGMFWLWVLGAYEVVRTMSQHSKCFAEPVVDDIRSIKKSLHAIRIPFAKQELPRSGGRKVDYVHAELSIHGIDFSRKDFTYQIRGTTVSTRNTILEFKTFILSIERKHITARYPIV